MARAIARATRAVDPGLAFLAIAGTQLEHAPATAEDLRTIREIYADRGYDDWGHLHSARAGGRCFARCRAVAAARATIMVEAGAIVAQSGKRVDPSESIRSACTVTRQGAVTMARAVRVSLEGAGLAVRPFAGT